MSAAGIETPNPLPFRAITPIMESSSDGWPASTSRCMDGFIVHTSIPITMKNSDASKIVRMAAKNKGVSGPRAQPAALPDLPRPYQPLRHLHQLQGRMTARPARGRRVALEHIVPSGLSDADQQAGQVGDDQHYGQQSEQEGQRVPVDLEQRFAEPVGGQK